MERVKISFDAVEQIPSEIAKVTYSGGVVVEPGKELTPTQVKDKPKVTWNADANALYTLYMTDIDTGILCEVIHWLVVNIPGTAVSKGETISEYLGSGPLPGNGKNRYVFFVYKQSGRISCSSEERKKFSFTEGRWAFNVRKFAEKYSLGKPIAYNFYEAEYDEASLALHALILEQSQQKLFNPHLAKLDFTATYQ